MKKERFLLVLLLLSGIAFGQTNTQKDCVLQSENNIWKIQFEKAQTKREKLTLIKEKIKSDSIYSQIQPKFIVRDLDVSNQNLDINGNNCGCKILFFIRYSKGKSVLLNLNSQPKLSKLVEKLSVENIDDIFYIFDINKSQSLYGPAGRCGIVHLSTKSKELKKLLKGTRL